MRTALKRMGREREIRNRVGCDTKVIFEFYVTYGNYFVIIKSVSGVLCARNCLYSSEQGKHRILHSRHGSFKGWLRWLNFRQQRHSS